MKEGKSWFRENGEMKFGFYFTEEKGYKYYSIMVPGKEGEVSIPKKGEPKAYTNLHLLMDGETGQVYTEEEFKNRNKSPKLPVPSKAKPILKKHGKPLSKNQWEKYQAKKNHKSF